MKYVFEVGSSALMSLNPHPSKKINITRTQRKDKNKDLFYDVTDLRSEDKLVATLFHRFMNNQLDCIVFSIGYYHGY